MVMAMTEAASAQGVLSIQVLGKFALRLHGRAIELPSRKARALLGYLVLNESSNETRERLIGILWSTSDTEHARGSLRQCLREIKAALPESAFDGLQAGRLAIALDRGRLDVDLWTVLDQAKKGRAPERLLDGPGLLEDMLQELDSVDPEFSTWLSAKRQTLKNRILQHLETPLRSDVQEEDESLRLARAILNLDPTHEEACRCVIRILAARGDANGAERVYSQLWDLLANVHDSRPDLQTQDLIAEIKARIPYSDDNVPGGRSGLSPATAPVFTGHALLSPDASGTHVSRQPIVISSPPLATPRHPRRADDVKLVLSISQFGLLGPDASPAHILQGFRRELIASLVRFREWVVREPVGVMVPNGDHDGYVLEADGVHVGDSIRLSLTLKESATSDFLWSEILDLKLETLFDTQRVVVRRIATALNVHLSAGRMASISPRPVENLKAYDIWLLGQATILTFDPKKWEKAEAMFREVIARYPTFAPAFSSLAQIYNVKHIVNPGIFRDPMRAEESLAIAKEAARLDPIDSRSQLCLGWSLAMAKQYDQALIHFPLAYELNDNDPWTLVSSANLFAFCGHHDRARQIANQLLQLPLEPSPVQWAYQASIRFLAGDYTGCVEAAQAAGDTNPNVPGYKAAALFHLGQHNDASAELVRFFGTIRRRWTNETSASDHEITRWFLSMFPIANPSDWMRLRDGLRGAGAPTEGLSHHDW
jgi:DNA-binding SARP family transcriptional activator